MARTLLYVAVAGGAHAVLWRFVYGYWDVFSALMHFAVFLLVALSVGQLLQFKGRFSLTFLFLTTAVLAVSLGFYYRPRTVAATVTLQLVPSTQPTDSGFEFTLAKPEQSLRRRETIEAAVSEIERRGENTEFLTDEPFSWYQEHLEVTLEPDTNLMTIRLEDVGKTKTAGDLVIALDELVKAFKQAALARALQSQVTEDSDHVTDQRLGIPVKVVKPLETEIR